MMDIGNSSHDDKWISILNPKIAKDEPQVLNTFPIKKYFKSLDPQPHILKPTYKVGHSHHFEAKASNLSSSGTSALLDEAIAKLIKMKSDQKFDFGGM
ncbi:hypothetical protein WICMUC_002359 [Wickerhamomyces mucosus]|uniref:Uncharacterized protein n=1 Tax=Wickerhamomyces mucosus TaxID=1378264 RepID=A0A9P8PR39_9ASCO|nr:hypothetical protein WICMUC_002359 [Wickerhamomyces mucosus]